MISLYIKKLFSILSILMMFIVSFTALTGGEVWLALGVFIICMMIYALAGSAES